MDKLRLRSSAIQFLDQEERLLLTYGKDTPQHLVGSEALCSFTQQPRAMKLPEMLSKIILVHPQNSCAFGQSNTARWERQRRRWDA